MRSARARLRFTGWVAILVVLLASLAPSLSHALGATQGASWVEICTAQGSKWVQGDSADSGGSKSAPAFAHPLEHCPYCSIHMPALGLPPTPLIVPLELGLEAEVPPAFLAAPRTSHAWVSAQPRAPPLFS